MNRLSIEKCSDRRFKSYDLKFFRSIVVEIFLTVAPACRLNCYPVRGFSV
jgi:hypothetical protein